MADSNIEWTNKTWNPTTGCTHISKECDLCYAEVMTKRMMHMPNQPRYKLGFDVFAEHEDALQDPFKWKKPRTVFVNSMSDLFHKDVTLEFLQKIFKIMNDTPQHTYQVLTKRHHELTKYSPFLNWTDNIWMGVSVGHVAGVRRIEELVKCGAKHKFLSVEPLIEELPNLNLKGIDWVIVGGESGDNRARPIKKEWVLKVKNNCKEQGVDFFFKQWGKPKHNPNKEDPSINKEHRYHAKGGCQLDGKYYQENPTIKNASVPVIRVFEQEYFLMDEYEGLNSIWELKSYLPMMDSELYSQLEDNIRKNGLNDPILYFITPEGTKLVIEGHTRLKACIKLKKKNIPTKEIKENFKNLDDIKFWMIKHQFQRRNLTSVEKIQLAYCSKEAIEKMAKDNLSKGGKNTQIDAPIDTNAEIAKLAGVGRASVVRYNSVLNNASKSIIKKLRRGEITISSAHNSVKNLPENHKPKVKIDKKVIQPNILLSIEEGTKQLEDGAIEGLLIIKNESQIDCLNNNQKTKYGIYLLK